MNIFADENIPLQIVTQLRAEGHQVEYVMQQVEDRIILENAYKQQALLITSDKDFGRLVLDEGKPTAGVLLLRVSRTIPMRAWYSWARKRFFTLVDHSLAPVWMFVLKL